MPSKRISSKRYTYEDLREEDAGGGMKALGKVLRGTSLSTVKGESGLLGKQG